MEIFALFVVCGLFTSLLIPEAKRKTLEELVGEVPGTVLYSPETADRRLSSAAGVEHSGSDEVVIQESNESSNV